MALNSKKINNTTHKPKGGNSRFPVYSEQYNELWDDVNSIDSRIIVLEAVSESSETKSSTTSITAYAGGGQANATQLTTEYNKITTVATAADSVKLPAALEGLRCVIVNADSADACDVFPSTGDNFEGLSANTAVSLTFSTSMEAFCFTDGEWTLL